MKTIGKGGWLLGIAFLFILVVFLPAARQVALGRAEEGAKPTGGPRYTVVETQGHNLLVTDNVVNKLYFYTVDKDKPVGSPLKLRASLDLSKVGEKEITITDHGAPK
jgi:hypothetical protein